MPRSARALSVLLTLLCTLVGCASPSKTDPFVEPERLASLAADPKVVLLDARSEADYSAGRVPNARRIDLKAWAEAVRAPGGASDTSGWSARISAAGISSSSSVLIYDSGGLTQAASTWFILQHFGVKDVRIVNGGLPAIEKASPGLVTRDLPEAFPAGSFTAAVDPNAQVAWAGKEDVKASIASGSASIFDARSADEFTGKDDRGNKRSGHLPGAANLSHKDLIGPDGKVRPAAELRRMMLDRGFKPGDRIILHCQSGARSSLAAAAALRAGFGPLENYYMSFGEWSEDESCPIEKVAEH